MIAEHPIRVLFVDDEPLVLQSLDRALRQRKVSWDARFIETSTGALELLASEQFDVVVADLRIPVLDGVALLTEIQRMYPRIARVVLSGQVGTDDCLRAMRVAHQCLAKPCDIGTLRRLMQRLENGQRLLDDSELVTSATQLSCLPSPPSVHAEVSTAITSGAGLAEIAQILDGDVAITAKLIQVVNSAFFTQGPPVTTVQRALVVLGTDVVCNLLLSVEVFRGFEGRGLAARRLEALRRHSKLVGLLAQALAPRELAGDAFAAGMLHDTGNLVLACLDRPAHQVTDHARAGGFLLGLWGLKEAVVDAITYHHDPGEATGDAALLTDLVHVSEIVVDDLERAASSPDAPVDPAWLARNDATVLERARTIGRAIWEQTP
ncbi:MAG TPA: HDOD domain-containing protein [Kofleriaceae bacterium]|nr:HDOD domain-containing protein [Kofleriaceae bacterium]